MILKIQAYSVLGRVHWSLTIRDIDAGPDEEGLLVLNGGLDPWTEGSEVDACVLAAHHALQSVLQSHNLRHRED